MARDLLGWENGPVELASHKISDTAATVWGLLVTDDHWSVTAGYVLLVRQ